MNLKNVAGSINVSVFGSFSALLMCFEKSWLRRRKRFKWQLLLWFCFLNVSDIWTVCESSLAAFYTRRRGSHELKAHKTEPPALCKSDMELQCPEFRWWIEQHDSVFSLKHQSVQQGLCSVSCCFFCFSSEENHVLIHRVERSELVYDICGCEV